MNIHPSQEIKYVHSPEKMRYPTKKNAIIYNLDDLFFVP